MSEPDAKRIKLTDGSASPVRERTLIALEKSKKSDGSESDSDDGGNTEVELDLLERWSPFNETVWRGMEKPLTREEIADRIREKKLCAEPYKHFAPVEWDREKHLRRVAFFVVNPDSSPIGIDVGFGLDDERWIIHNGNHRLAAAFYRGDKTISAGISGCLDTIKELLTRAAK